MKNLKLIFLTTVIFLLISLNSCDRIIKGDVTSVTGIVTNELNEPLDSVKIELFGSCYSILSGYHTSITNIYTYTNSKGEYSLTFSQTDGCEYMIRPSIPYYVYRRGESIQTTCADLKEGLNQRINLELKKYGKTTIEGVITETDTQNTLENVKITITIYEDTTKIFATAHTNQDGYYKLEYLQDYYFKEHTILLKLDGYKSRAKMYNYIAYPDKINTKNFEMEKIN